MNWQKLSSRAFKPLRAQIRCRRVKPRLKWVRRDKQLQCKLKPVQSAVRYNKLLGSVRGTRSILLCLVAFVTDVSQCKGMRSHFHICIRFQSSILALSDRASPYQSGKLNLAGIETSGSSIPFLEWIKSLMDKNRDRRG
jgi:hypothetical protein